MKKEEKRVGYIWLFLNNYGNIGPFRNDLGNLEYAQGPRGTLWLYTKLLNHT